MSLDSINEKYDGTGYPNRLSGEAIHLHSRVFAVADAFDAITSDRPYRASQPYSHACAEILAGSGKHFDPRIVKAFMSVPEAELEDIRYWSGGRDYIERLIDEREIRALIVSLKYRTATTRSQDAGIVSNMMM
jgi:hypothetical protein